ncbi:unnamed protein product [Adineta ricciae]|uniref:ABC transmembrane type-1 domain-containing protein n=1 Tax=Adineta ricciae TaxID=249248 RepID=A0A814SWP0_ADIRI|nr:unnamed protein product [Adineta ricciae]
MQTHEVENDVKQRESSRLAWAQSSCTRWIYLIFFSWATPILSLSNRRTITSNDFSDLAIIDKSSSSLNRVESFISTWPGTWHVILRTFFNDYIPTLLLLFPYIAVRLAQPWLIRELVLYIQGQSTLPVYAAYLYTATLCAAAILYGIIHQHIEFQNTRVGMRVQTALSCAIYKHLLTVSTVEFHKNTTAQVINLVANDTSKFQELVFFAYALILSPLEAVSAFILIWWYIGVPT